MSYAEYQRYGLPIGSGVTEAACKTVFTQRFKESGMSWKNESGQIILDLRIIRLSGLWAEVHHAYLKNLPSVSYATKSDSMRLPCKLPPKLLEWADGTRTKLPWLANHRLEFVYM